jgi:glycosyltransferase involved in cell wall biosynthesis
VQVLIDDQIFLLNSRGGISRYFAELIREFREHPEWGIDAVTSVRTTPNQHLRDVDTSMRDIKLTESSFGWRVVKGFARISSTVRERRLRPDVVHSTYYRPSKLRSFPGVPHVVTVHDMAPELLPPEWTDQTSHMAKKAYVADADAIICVSEATRDALFEVWGEITDRPVLVTAHAVSARFSPFVSAADEGFAYFLHVGRRDGYKNFEVLARAYAASGAPTRGVRLLLIGGGPLTAAEHQLLTELDIDELVVQRTADESELPGLYRGAIALTYPSLMEGFGIPVLEAMSTGCPVILADTPVFREVGGTAARYHEPTDVDGLRHALDEVLTDRHLRESLCDAGVQRATGYSWETTAKLTGELYQQLVEARRR